MEEYYENIRKMYAVTMYCCRTLKGWLVKKAPDGEKRNRVDVNYALQSYTKLIEGPVTKSSKKTVFQFLFAAAPIYKLMYQTTITIKVLMKMRTQVELFYKLNINYKAILTDNWLKFFPETYDSLKKKSAITKTTFVELTNKKLEKIRKNWAERHYFARKLQFSKDQMMYRQFKLGEGNKANLRE